MTPIDLPKIEIVQSLMKKEEVNVTLTSNKPGLAFFLNQKNNAIPFENPNEIENPNFAREFGSFAREFGSFAREFGSFAREFGSFAREFGSFAREFGSFAREFGSFARK